MSRDSNAPACMRADKWLWAARFYKTRPMATAAINGGKVHINGERVKPAKKLVPGDALTIQKGPYLWRRVACTLNRKIVRGKGRPCTSSGSWKGMARKIVNVALIKRRDD